MPGTTPTNPTPYGIAPPAYRLPEVTHLGGVHLLVSDLARSRAFYEGVLGLRPLVVEAGQVTFGAHGDDAAPSAGAPTGTTVGHVHLHVGGLGPAEAFYHRALGLDKTVWDYPGALFLSAGGYHHHVGTNTWSPGPAPSADQARLLEWELIVPSDADVAAAARSLEAGGHVVSQAASGVSAPDPWGTPVRVRTKPQA